MTTATGLTELERAVLTAYAYSERRPDRIAADMGLSTSTVRGVLHRCCNFEVPRALRLVTKDGLDPEPPPPTAIPEPGEEPCAGTDDMIAIGLTYRQLDYWTRAGHLKVVGDPTPGIGRKRAWPIGEVDVAALMLRLVNAGLDLEVAAQVARDGTHELAPGIHLLVKDVPPSPPRPRVRRERPATASGCPDRDRLHTPGQPTNPAAWQEWADAMSRTHVQTRCPSCRQWAVWRPNSTITDNEFGV